MSTAEKREAIASMLEVQGMPATADLYRRHVPDDLIEKVYDSLQPLTDEPR